MGCRACHGKIVSLHKDRTKTHCKGKKHVLNVKKLFQTKEEDKNTFHANAEVSEESGGMYGDALSDEAKLTQIKAVKGCLAAGIPLNAMDNPIFPSFLSHCNVDCLTVRTWQNTCRSSWRRSGRSSKTRSATAPTPSASTLRRGLPSALGWGSDSSTPVEKYVMVGKGVLPCSRLLSRSREI
ncbi:unnamed protein product [Ectocarpus sp. CCAP 1310/34]|nr:unnamed protein product [Ectocarpus sp. CCAP 1310/34]